MSELDFSGKVVILAAGSSSRLGSPKQLLPFSGKTLIEHSIDSALHSGIGEIIVVLGANIDRIMPVIENHPCTILINSEWQEGMASSIRKAVEHMKEGDLPYGAVFMVCDQPYVSVTLLRDLWQKIADGNYKAAACLYEGRLGTPAAFHNSFFQYLLELTGDRGAGKFLNDHKSQVFAIPFPEGTADIDTEQEYKALIHGTSNDR